MDTLSSKPLHLPRQRLALRAAPCSKSTSYVGHLAALGLLRYRGNRAGATTQQRRPRAFVYKHDPHHQLGRVSNVYCRRSDCRRENLQQRDRLLVSVKGVADYEQVLKISRCTRHRRPQLTRLVRCS